jgi:hypothetical protein
MTNQDDGSPNSLRAEITAAASGDTISFDQSLSGLTINLNPAKGELLANKNLHIAGLGADQLTISGQNQVRVFEVASGANVTLSDLTVTHGNGLPGNSAALHPNRGGGVVVDEGSTLTITGSTVSDSSATLNLGGLSGGGLGGGIADYGTLTVSNCQVTDNVAETTFGGGIAVFFATLTVSDSIVSDNEANQNGGGIQGVSSTVSVSDSTLSGNSASTRNGGGIYNSGGALTITGCTVTGNTAAVDGGGIANNSATNGIANSNGVLTVSGSNVSKNFCTLGGGGIFNLATAKVSISGITLSDNTAATGTGGGIVSQSGPMFLSASTLSRNSGSQAGGGIFNVGTLVVGDCTFSDNAAFAGGGIWNIGPLSVGDSTFSGNSAVAGGGIQNLGSLAISGSTLCGNSASAFGGGINNEGASYPHPPFPPLILVDSIVAENSSSIRGPDIAGPVTSGFNNLIGSSNDLISGLSDGVNGNRVGLTALQVGLVPLADNGGPTDTVALLPDSLAIGAGAAPGQLAADFAAADTTLTLAGANSLALIPGSTVLRIDDEQILVTAVDGNILTVARGDNGTDVTDHATGSGVYSALDQRGVLRAVPPCIGACEAPSLTLDRTTLDLGTTTYGAAGTTASYTITGNALTGSVVVTAPAGVEVSKDGANWSASLLLSPCNHTLASTTIDVRIRTGDNAGDVSGVIQDTSIGAKELDLSFEGTVTQASTTTAVASSLSTSVFGQSVTLTATIGVVAPGAGTPTGVVTFWDGNAPLGAGTLNSSGQASITTAMLSVGKHDLTAVYSGNSNFLGSPSAVFAQTVLSAQQELALIVTQVQTMMTNGILNPGNGNALIAKLNAAIASLDKGNAVAGVNQMDAFINQADALVNANKLDSTDEQLLVDEIDLAIDAALAHPF